MKFRSTQINIEYIKEYNDVKEVANVSNSYLLHLNRYFDTDIDRVYYIEGDFTETLKASDANVEKGEKKYNLLNNNCASKALEFIQLAYDPSSEEYEGIRKLMELDTNVYPGKREKTEQMIVFPIRTTNKLGDILSEHITYDSKVDGRYAVAQ